MSGIQFKNNRLRQLRQERGLSLRALSERTGVDFATISFCEKGQRNFSANSLQALASFFGVSVDYLLGKTAEQIYTDFVRSFHHDFMRENSFSDGAVTQSLADDIPDPIRTKIEILFALEDINSSESLEMILNLARLRSAHDDFGGDSDE